MTSTAPGDSSSRMSAMSLADMRAYVTAEMSRFKNDVSSLHEKINALKDTHNNDKMALITQLNQEFTKLTSRMNDIALTLQRILGDSEHAGESIEARFSQFELEFDNKLMAMKLEDAQHNPNAEMTALKTSLTSIQNTLTAYDAKFKELTKSVNSVSGKIKSISWKLALVIGALTWLLNTFAGDAVKAIFMSRLTPPTAQAVVDTAKSKPAKDTVTKAGK